jgi:hypothetical protein
VRMGPSLLAGTVNGMDFFHDLMVMKVISGISAGDGKNLKEAVFCFSRNGWLV